MRAVLVFDPGSKGYQAAAVPAGSGKLQVGTGFTGVEPRLIHILRRQLNIAFLKLIKQSFNL